MVEPRPSASDLQRIVERAVRRVLAEPGTDRREPFDVETLEAILAEVRRQVLGPGDPVSAAIPLERVDRSAQVGACRAGIAGSAATAVELAGYIDHTLLRPDASSPEIDRLCDEAARHRFACVCVHGTWVRHCASLLAGSDVAVCCVVGFPFGAATPEVKAYEARRAIEDGACEIDMVQNIGALKSGDEALVRRDIGGVAAVCHPRGAILKVILETALLSDEEKVRACEIAKAAGADFVKTSTGFARGGATVEDVALMRRTVGPTLGVKAAGGVRDEKSARALLAAGATRLGASASVAIVRGGTGSGSY